MTAITANIGQVRNRKLLPEQGTLHLRASQTFYPGALVAHRVGSNLAEAISATAPRTDLIIVGCATHYVASTASVDSDNNAIDSDSRILTVCYETGLLGFFDTGTGGNAITDAYRGRPAYAYDNNTLYLTDNNGTLSYAGMIHSVDADGVRLFIAPEVEGAQDVYGALSAADSGPLELMARAVMTSLGACTVSAGVLTVTANGALATQDGVSTLAVGDTVIAPAGLTNLPTAQDSGPYEIVSLGSVSTPVVLRRPAWFANGAAVPQGITIAVGGEGTLYPGTSWRSFADLNDIVGTDNPLFWPDFVSQQVTLVAGTVTISNVPIRSASKSLVSYSRITANTVTNTVQYNPSTFTAGALGTASLVFQAQVAAGTINASDVSTLNVGIRNWG